MEVKHHKGETGGSFYYEENGHKLAEMTYTMAGEQRMIIDHTEVDASLQGKGVGKVLLAELVAYVRANKITVIPLCPFANATFKRTPEWGDVLI
ncbi:MAG: GNAT family N-acetyltransferase [Bacteroidota bacterium]